jgi:predicted phosphodiesterase
MRYGIIADVHANAHALDAALAFLASQNLDGYLCAGDLVGYGPLPNECVRRVLALPGRCVAGNHDLIALGRLSDERCIPLAKASLRWTCEVLDDDVRALLADLPVGATVDDIALRHGSITDPQEYVVTDTQARYCLEELERATPAATILVIGHTHRPMAVSRRRGALLQSGTGEIDLPTDEPILLNPGAVGQSRSADPRARVVVLDTGARVAGFHALDYDIEGCRRALQERGLPPTSCHLPRSRWADAAGVVKRHVRGLLQPLRSGRPLR